MEYLIRRSLFNYYFRRQEKIRQLDTRLYGGQDFKSMAETVTRGLRDILRVKQACLYIKRSDTLTLISAVGAGELQVGRIRFDADFYEPLFTGRRVLDLREFERLHDGRPPVYSLDILEHEGNRYLIPLWHKESLNAIVTLGPETDERFALTGEDKKILWQSLQRVGHTLENGRLYGQLQKMVLEKELVLGVAKKFNTAVHVDKLLDMIMDSIRSIVPYDAAGIFLVNEDTQEIESAVLRGYDPEVMDKLQMKVGMGLIGQTAKTGKIMVVKDVSFSEEYVEARPQTQSEVVIPICDNNNRVIGILNLESDRLGAYQEEHLDILSALAGEAAIAIRNARLHEEAVRTEELEKELEIAGKIQEAILSKKLPHIEMLDISARSIPCRAVGGDFYDILRLNERQIAVCIGDVSGKGVPGAIMMSVLYTSYRSIVRDFPTTAETVSSLNNLLCTHTAVGTYATFFYAIIDFESLVVYYTNAGHNPPLVCKSTGEVIRMQRGGLVLGFLPEQDYRQMTQVIDPGDILVFYTDGVTEVFNEADEMFGDSRLQRVVEANRQRSAREIQEAVVEAVRQFAPDTEQQDDLTIVVIKIERE
jgi:sigma-B regulation protein RsbU (phosphoserine phosphatase)